MKNAGVFAILFIAVLIWGLHLLALNSSDCFGFDLLKYFPGPLPLILTALFLVVIGASALLPFNRIFARFSPRLFYILIAVFWLAALILLQTSAPLLGDGLDRITGLPEGLLKNIRDQPAPLDIFLHWAAYMALSPLTQNAGLLSYSLLSYLAGIAYLLAVVVFAEKFFPPNPARFFFAAAMLAAGYAQLFAGYAENYSFLPAGIMLWSIGLLDAQKNKLSLLALAQVLLIFLHFFFLLLLPVTLAVLWSATGKKRLIWSSFLLLLGAGIALFSFFIVRNRYRGPAIFMVPFNLSRGSHLLDFANYQMLASPALLLLLAGFGLGGRKLKMDQAEKSLLAASAVMGGFFFILRPVLGAVRDWDLFSIPAMIYTPFLAGLVFRRIDPERILGAMGACVFAVSLFHTGGWLLLNHSEAKMTERITSHLEARQNEERWACGWGFLVMAKSEQMTGELDESDAHYKEAAKINPGYSVIHQEYGQFLWARKQFPEAIAEMETARRVNPRNPKIKGLLQYFYLKYAEEQADRSQFQNAETALLKLYDLSPHWEPGLKELARFYKIYVPDEGKAGFFDQELKKLSQ